MNSKTVYQLERFDAVNYWQLAGVFATEEEARAFAATFRSSQTLRIIELTSRVIWSNAG